MNRFTTWAKRVKDNSVGKVMLICFVAILVTLLAIDTAHSRIWTDEVVFYRLTQNLPSYSTTSDWVKDMDLAQYIVPTTDYWEKAYNTPVWSHPPLGPVLAWPLVKLGMSIRALKVVADLMLLGALYLIFRVIRRHLSLLKTMYCLFPVLALTTGISGAAFFYHDIFMVLFLAITIFLVDKGSKWAYVAAAALTLTKIDAILFLIPLALYQKNWKMLLPGLVLGLFWIQVWATTGQFFYIVTRWTMVGGLVKGIWGLDIIPYIAGQLLRSNYGVILPIFIYTLLKTRPLWLVTLAGVSLALATYAFAANHITQLLLVLPIVTAAYLIFRQQKTKELVHV